MKEKEKTFRKHMGDVYLKETVFRKLVCFFTAFFTVFVPDLYCGFIAEDLELVCVTLRYLLPLRFLSMLRDVYVIISLDITLGLDTTYS